MPQNSGPRLDGWKAIADYLARDVRTAQRWREERGMPVHRVPGSKGGTVFAYRAELDAWLAAGPSLTIRGERPGLPEPANDVATAVVINTGTPEPAHVGSRSRRRRWMWAVLAAAVVGSAALALAALTSALSRRPLDHLELHGRGFRALDADGKIVWSSALPPEGSKYAAQAAAVDPVDLASVLVDLLPEPGPEVVAFVRYNQQVRDRDALWVQEVLCFSSAGSLLWTFRSDDRFTFADRVFGGPWRLRDWSVSSTRNRAIWVSFIHDVWWPSFVVRLDSKGTPQTVFVNAGHIETVRPGRLGNDSVVLAGGVNNEYQMAALAILDEDSQLTSSPQSPGSAFRCQGCPADGPRAYVLFPRSELNVALRQRYNFADLISTAPNLGPIEVSVREEPALRLRSVYTLSNEGTPVSVAMSDHYWEKHRELSADGTLDHPPEACRERIVGMAVRVWRPSTGWRDVAVRPATSSTRGRDTATENDHR